MTKDEALNLALEALETIAKLTGARWALEQGYAGHLEAITEIRQAFAAQPTQQEPIDLVRAIEYADARWSGVDVPIEWARHFAEGIRSITQKWGNT